MRHSALLWIALIAAIAGGCECGRGGEPGTPSAPVAGGGGRSRKDVTSGTVTGVVRLAPGTELPMWPDHPLQAEGRPAIPERCTPPSREDRMPVRVADESGGLVGLSIVATGEDESRWPRPSEPRLHEVRIRDCRLMPSIVVATRGDRLRLVNETDYPFFPDLGEGMIQYRTEPREIELDRGGVRTIQCAFAAPCGRLELITLYHPVHTVTQGDGRFRLEEVPADQPVRITAWHPLFEEVATSVIVPAGGTVEVELTIRPAPIQVPPSAREVNRPPGPAEDHPDPTAPF